MKLRIAKKLYFSDRPKRVPTLRRVLQRLGCGNFKLWKSRTMGTCGMYTVTEWMRENET